MFDKKTLWTSVTLLSRLCRFSEKFTVGDSQHVSVTVRATTTLKITPADCKRLQNHSTEVAENFVGCLVNHGHELETWGVMKYSLVGSESELEEVTWRADWEARADSHVEDQS